MEQCNYWGYRIDTREIEFFTDELNQGRLRQGWGWDEGQNLKDMHMDEGAGRNLAMFERVKQGDILLIPRLPDWDSVTIAEATADWDNGYYFEIAQGQTDYGHAFPARRVRTFVRNSPIVKSSIRTTLHARSRFWNINHCADEIKTILCAEKDETQIALTHEARMESVLSTSFLKHFKEDDFSAEILNGMNEHFRAEEWEYALVHGLKLLFPFYEIERTGGPEESKHGTDILIKLPDLFLESRYAIAIQVKDFDGFVKDDVINQINKADAYWQEKDLVLIDKVVIITKAQRENNLHLPGNVDGVKFYFASELKKLLLAIGKSFIGISDTITN